MRTTVCGSYEQMSRDAARLVASQINLKPNCVLGFATGRTPIGMYETLVRMYNSGETDFSGVTSFNLDEYYPIPRTNEQSYHYYMNLHLFSKVNIDIKRTHIPDGETDDPKRECESYESEIARAGGIDLQILGIGRNGHIGFNEPDSSLNSKTHVARLRQSTIDANSCFFKNSGDMPKHAITMGIATILMSRKIVLLASGTEKHEVVKALLNDEINTSVPATMLKVHPDVTLICDAEAYNGKRG